MPASLVLLISLLMYAVFSSDGSGTILYGRHIISGSVVCREIEAEDDV